MIKSYNFCYIDRQYMTYDLTPDDVEALQFALSAKEVRPFIVLSCGAVSTEGLRFVKLVEDEVIENESVTPPEYDLDMMIYMQQGSEDEDDGRPV